MILTGRNCQMKSIHGVLPPPDPELDIGGEELHHHLSAAHRPADEADELGRRPGQAGKERETRLTHDSNTLRNTLIFLSNLSALYKYKIFRLFRICLWNARPKRLTAATRASSLSPYCYSKPEKQS